MWRSCLRWWRRERRADAARLPLTRTDAFTLNCELTSAESAKQVLRVVRAQHAQAAARLQLGRQAALLAQLRELDAWPMRARTRDRCGHATQQRHHARVQSG